ncbi:MAG: preprotein translocase subunit SecE [bacterium]
MKENEEQSKDVNKSSKSEKEQTGNKSKESFFKPYKDEFNKITWPTKPVLIKHTITVITFCLIIGSITFVYDFGIDTFLSKLAELVS